MRFADILCAAAKNPSPEDGSDPGLVPVRGRRSGCSQTAKGHVMNNEPNNPKTKRHALKLSDTQLMLLSAAAQRDDLCLTPRPNLRGGAAHKVAEKLIAAGFVKEVLAKAGAPVWRRDQESEQSFALKLTTAVSEAIGVDQSEGQEVAGDPKTTTNDDRSNSAYVTERNGRGLTTCDREGVHARPGDLEGGCFRSPVSDSSRDRHHDPSGIAFNHDRMIRTGNFHGFDPATMFCSMA
jgi:hypothetical protein